MFAVAAPKAIFPWLSCCTFAEVAKAAKGLVVTARKFNGNWPIWAVSFESLRTAFSVLIITAVSLTSTIVDWTGEQGSQAQTLDLVTSFCRRLRTLADTLRASTLGGEEFIVTAGGSAFFDVVARELTAGGTGGPTGGTGGTGGITAILRSGAYLTHDHGFYAAVSPAARGSSPAPGLRPALE